MICSRVKVNNNYKLATAVKDLSWMALFKIGMIAIHYVYHLAPVKSRLRSANGHQAVRMESHSLKINLKKFSKKIRNDQMSFLSFIKKFLRKRLRKRKLKKSISKKNFIRGKKLINRKRTPRPKLQRRRSLNVRKFRKNKLKTKRRSPNHGSSKCILERNLLKA